MSVACCKILVPTGALGLGFPDAALARGIELSPDCIAVDAGSTDSGPFYLGTGTSKMGRAAIKRDLRRLMGARDKLQIPLLIGSCGTCGTDCGVDWTLDILSEIAREDRLAVRVATIFSEQPVERMMEALKAGAIHPLAPAAALSEEVLRECQHIVALLGAEPLIDAVRAGADIILCGRTTDTALIAAVPLMRGCSAAASWHAAKIAECGGLCTTHSQLGGVLLTINTEQFIVEPLHPESRCTPDTVSAHLLYENSDPYCLIEPGIVLHTEAARYEALDERRVAVRGSTVTQAPYTLKLEGAGAAGFRTMIFVAIADPHILHAVDLWLDRLKAHLHQEIYENLALCDADYSMELRPYGWNGLGGPEPSASPLEIGLMVIVSAKTQDQAREIARVCNPSLLHFPLNPDDPMPSFAFPYSPPELDLGEHHEFKLNHVISIDHPSVLSRTAIVDVGGGR